MKKKRTSKTSRKSSKITKLSWQAEEYLPKNLPWLAITAGIFGGLIVLTFYLKLYLTTIVVAVAAIAVYRFAYLRPAKITVEVSPTGIKVNRHHFRWGEIRSFWIGKTPKGLTLNLSLVNPWFSRLVLPLGRQDPRKVRQVFQKHLIPEYANWQDLIMTELGKIFRL